MDPTYELISEQVLTSNQSSVTFSNIPQTYRDLYLTVSCRTTRASIADNILMKINGVTTNRTVRYLGSNGSSVYSASESTAYAGDCPGANATASTFGNLEIYIPNYLVPTNKSFSITSTQETNGPTAYITTIAGLWSSQDSINNLEFSGANGTLTASSSFYLYGIKNADDGSRGYFGSAATGGDEVFTTGNGYKVHVFKNSGILNVTAPGEIEYLVIAGGGSGGPTSATGLGGGGGGAGGYRSSVGGENSGGGSQNEKPILLSQGTYSILVGAGGSGTSTSVRGGTGSNSQLFSITSIGGGGGGGTQSEFSGGNGGSGGGSYANVSPVGSGITGQGYSGGVVSVSGNQGAGGGGGAGSVGETRFTSNNGDGSNGGSGASSVITGTAITRAGGGAGGGSLTTGNSGSAGSGGGGRDGDTINGTTNTGSGGGGATAKLPSYASSKLGGNGGSGIVIIRYRI